MSLAFPKPCRTPTASQRKVAITRDLQAEIEAWRAFGAEAIAEIDRRDHILAAAELQLGIVGRELDAANASIADLKAKLTGAPATTPTPSPQPDPKPAPRAVAREIVPHAMACYLGGLDGTESCGDSVKRMSSLKWRTPWLHYDNPPWRSGNYETVLQQMLDAALNADVHPLPGFHGNGVWSAADIAKFVDGYAHHPAMYRPRGKPVFVCYDFRDSTTAAVLEAKQTLGFDFELWAFAEPVEGFSPSLGPDNFGDWPGLANFLKVNAVVDCFVNFAVGGAIPHDDPRKVDWMIARNNRIATVCRDLGKISAGGFAARYQLRQMSNDGMLRVWDALLANPPDYVSIETWNDRNMDPGGDASAIGDWGTDFDGDSVWAPQRNAGWGTPKKYPRCADIRALIAPKIDAYLALP